jgi:excisionase family DNA binding protein
MAFRPMDGASFEFETPMYTLKEAAARIGISRPKLYQLVEQRKLSHYRVGGKILFSDSDLDEYLASCRVEKAVLASARTTAVRVTLRHLTAE